MVCRICPQWPFYWRIWCAVEKDEYGSEKDSEILFVGSCLLYVFVQTAQQVAVSRMVDVLFAI